MAKGRRPRRGRKTNWVGYVLSFFLGAFLAIAGYHYVTQKESPPRQSLTHHIALADQIIHSQFYESGLSKKDVLRWASSKKDGDLVWQQSVLKVQLPRSLPLSSVEVNFKARFSSLGDPFSIESTQKGDSLQINVEVFGHVTHQLTLTHAFSSTLKSGLRPKISIVIDDLGTENEIARELLQWEVPLTFSILPFTPYAKNFAAEANRKGKEVILHLPMEPHGYPKVNPGEGALLCEMDEATLLSQLSRDIEAVPYVKGVNNHMGSRLMEQMEKTKIIFSELKKRGLFFLDSRTTPQTVGLRTAKSMGLIVLERDIFLDHGLNEEAIHRNLEELVQHSLTHGKAIAIGHPHPETLNSLKRMIPKMQAKGIEIVSLSAMVD